jgi:hypothetical protein
MDIVEMKRKYVHKSRAGQPFIVYALVCPRTLLVRYVGQTATELAQRTHNHTPAQFKGAMREWLESLLPEHPIAVVLENGVNDVVKMRSSIRREATTNGRTRWGHVTLWRSTIRETTWQKRFRRTLLNDAAVESIEVDALLKNPKFPWDK